MASGRRQLSIETIALFAAGAVFVGVGAFICVTAYRTGEAPVGPIAAQTVASLTPALPPALPPTVEPEPAPAEFAPSPQPTSIFAPPRAELPVAPRPRPVPARTATPARLERPTSPSIVLGAPAPFPPLRPIELNAPPAPRPTEPSVSPASRPTELASRPPSSASTPKAHASVAEFGPKPAALSQYDRFTAIYDLSAHTVYLPNGERLEAHSGLGPLKDDPGHVDERDRGATPPHLYDLTLREDLFHGVQALRLNPVGGAGEIFGRAGLLAHTYMLGPNGDSNGCVSFKNYDAFLQAYQSGLIKRLAVVSSVR